MADKNSVDDWSTTPTDNDNIAGLPLGSGQTYPSHVNNMVQAMMSQVKERFGELETFPAGASVAFSRSSAPPGWLKENGAAVSRTTYAALYAAIGTTYGAGDGTTTFNLPDSRGEFVRGWDDGRGIDSGRALGSAQSDQLKAHVHTASAASDGAHSHTASTSSDGAHTHTYGGVNSGSRNYQNTADGGQILSTGLTTSSAGAHTHTVTVASAGAHTHAVTIDSTGGAENRPRNVAKLICIKY